jgi:nitrite reductase (cytochrome c-552)
LRHTLACRLVCGGSPIKEVADVLRHRSLNTSLIYAKLDHGALAGVALLGRAAKATTDMLDALVAARKSGATDAELTAAHALQRRAQWRLDFVAAENSMGFHAPQELARVLAEAIDYARQGQREAERAPLKR